MDENSAKGSTQDQSNFDLEDEAYVMPEASVAHDAADESGNPLILVAAVVVLVVALAGIGAYIYLGMQNTPENEVTQPANDEPANKEASTVASEDAINTMQDALEDAPPATKESVEAMRARLSGSADADIE